MRRIDLGCGNNKRDGYIGIDRYPYPSADIIRDADLHGLPFDDNSVDELYTSHFLEHCHNLVFVMNEIHRVLKLGGRATILVPNIMHSGAFRDPTHVRFFNVESFLYFARHEWVYDGLQIKPFKLIEQKSNVQEIKVILEK
ncbi:MAG: class I SAM-dependent methyltransferase [Candidatus Brocadiales bacterium]